MPEAKNNAKDLKAVRRAEKVAAKAAQQQQQQNSNDPTTEQQSIPAQVSNNKKTTQQKAEASLKDNVKKAAPTRQTQSNCSSGASNLKTDRTVALFSHLEQKRPLRTDNVSRDVHPAVVALGLRYSSNECIGSNTRCVAMLRTFQRVIREYSTPTNVQTSLQRHLPTYLSIQISYLVNARPLSTSMGSAIRALKQRISTTDIEGSDETNKTALIEFIDTFIKERIEIAGQVIVKAAQERLVDGDVVLVYAHSTIVEAILLEAAKKVDISVIVVDSRPNFEGRKMITSMSQAGIKCSYIMLTAVSYIMATVSKVLIGAHTVLSNGAVYSRIGTALVAMVASERHIPVIVACETYKFSDRVQLDSFVTNELGSTSELDLAQASSDPVTVPLLGPTEGSTTTAKVDHTAGAHSRSSQFMKLNLMYDVTPDKYVTMCISELGSLPTTAIPFAAATSAQ